MTDTVLTALIAAGAALFGAFLGPFTDFLNNKRAMEQRLWSERRFCYSELLQGYICLLSELNSFQVVGDQPHYDKFQEAHTQFEVAYCRAVLICEDSNKQKLSDYFDEVQKYISSKSSPSKLQPLYRVAFEAMRDELLSHKTFLSKIHKRFSQKLPSRSVNTHDTKTNQDL